MALTFYSCVLYFKVRPQQGYHYSTFAFICLWWTPDRLGFDFTVYCIWCKCRWFSCCIVTKWTVCLNAAGGEIFNSRYTFSESSAWSEWECWPPPGPWSQLCLLRLNLPCSFPPSHCPFDDVPGKAKSPGQLPALFSQRTGEISSTPCLKMKKQKALI